MSSVSPQPRMWTASPLPGSSQGAVPRQAQLSSMRCATAWRLDNSGCTALHGAARFELMARRWRISMTRGGTRS